MIDTFDRFIRKWGLWFSRISSVGLVFLLTSIVVDIVGSKVFNKPLHGSLDVVGLTGLIVAAFALSQSHLMGRNIRVDFITIRLKERTQAILKAIVSVFSIALWITVLLSLMQRAGSLRAAHEGSHNLEIPMFPFAYLIALGIIPLLLVIIIELFQSLRKARI
ncbi:TRAP transporter small permease subunit [Chloroflexota bacterium]